MTGFQALPLKGLGRILAVSIAVIGGATVAPAQSQELTIDGGQQAAQTAALTSEDPTPALLEIVEANQAGGVDALTKALSPLVIDNPALAQTLIEIAKAKPELAETLAEVLARIQKTLKDLDPDKAQQIATVVASADPAFQAAYAVAQSSGDGGAQVADAGGGAAGGGAGATTSGAGSGAGGIGYGGGLGGGGSIGGGGGTVSPAAP